MNMSSNKEQDNKRIEKINKEIKNKSTQEKFDSVTSEFIERCVTSIR